MTDDKSIKHGICGACSAVHIAGQPPTCACHLQPGGLSDAAFSDPALPGVPTGTGVGFGGGDTVPVLEGVSATCSRECDPNAIAKDIRGSHQRDGIQRCSEAVEALIERYSERFAWCYGPHSSDDYYDLMRAFVLELREVNQ